MAGRGAEEFTDRLDELAQRIGRGTLRGSVVYDQIYAHYQHNGLDLRHPSGGQALFLTEPLVGGTDDWCSDLADAVLEGDHDLVQAMIDVVENIADASSALAPVDFNNLRRSAHPSVTSAGATVYDRAPGVPRLTEAELRELARARSAGRTHRIHRHRPGG